MQILRHDVGRGRETTVSFGVALPNKLLDHNLRRSVNCISQFQNYH